MEGVIQFTEVSNIPQRGLKNSRRHQTFHRGGSIIHGVVKHSMEGVQ